MTKSYLCIGSSIYSALFAALLVTLATPAFAADQACGTLSPVKGDIKIQRAAKITAAQEGSKICVGDTVIAGVDSRTKITMADGNQLNISPNSKMAIDQYAFKPAENKKRVLLNVIYGKVRATTATENMYGDKAKDGSENSFRVKTKTAVAGVRGTDFLTSFDRASNKAEFVTFHGRVEVGSPGVNGTIIDSVQVPAGQKTDVPAGNSAPTPPVELPKAQMEKIAMESAIEQPIQAAGPTDSTRQPGSKEEAKDKDKAKEPTQEPTKEPAKDQPKEQGPTADAGGKSGDRTPASAGPSGPSGSMLDKNDLPSSANYVPPTMPNMPGAGMPDFSRAPNAIVPVNPATTCDICNSAVQNGNSKVILTVVPQ